MYSSIMVDAEKCAGCRICETVCSLRWSQECNPERSKIRVLRTEDDGMIYAIPMLCAQCEQPMCMALCPTKAIYIDQKTGSKNVDEKKCIGCRTCVNVCPFGGVFVDHVKGVASKCQLCEGSPSCVDFCPTGAIKNVRQDKMNSVRRREKMGNFLELQKLVGSSSREEI